MSPLSFKEENIIEMVKALRCDARSTFITDSDNLYFVLSKNSFEINYGIDIKVLSNVYELEHLYKYFKKYMVLIYNVVCAINSKMGSINIMCVKVTKDCNLFTLGSLIEKDIMKGS